MANSEKESVIKVLIHPGTKLPQNYINMVRSRWVRSYKRDNDFMKIIHPPAYYHHYNNYVKMVLARPTATVRLAALSDDNDVVLGFSVIEGPVLHYVHVPRAYRKQGIGRLLVPNEIKWFTHITKLGLSLWSKLPGAKFDPFK